MKTLLATIALVVGFSAPAAAQEFTFVGDVNYQFNAQQFNATAGVEIEVVDNFFLTPSADFSYDMTNVTFEGIGVLAEYAVDENWTIYGDLEFDGKMKFDEFTAGVSVRF